ncbi:MAG: hypothetical protein ACJ787_04055 [Myxococcales bacterium]
MGLLLPPLATSVEEPLLQASAAAMLKAPKVRRTAPRVIELFWMRAPAPEKIDMQT